MKHLRAVIPVLIIIALIAGALWQASTFFLQNKVTFLLNQKKFDEATALVSRLTREDAENPKTIALRVKALTLTGSYAKAVSSPLDAEVTQSAPEVLYWQALAQRQLSRDEAATNLARQFLESGAQLPDQTSMLIAENIAGRNKPLPQPADQSRGYKLLFPIEQATYLEFVARREQALGRIAQAADLYTRSFVLGNRNREALLNGAEVSAISGETGQAEMLFAFSGTESIEPLFTRLLASYEQFKSAARTIHDYGLTGRGGRVDLGRALAWAAGLYLQENVNRNMYPVLRVMADLQQEFPYDRSITTSMAVVLESLQRYDEAYALYKKLYEDAPNLVLALRMWTLEALPEKEVTARIRSFIAPLEVVDSITTSDLNGKGFILKDEYLAFYENGIIATAIEVPESGSYTMTIIGRGDKAAEQWPLLRIEIDGELFAYEYIQRSSWDCYSLTLALDPGSHNLRLEYVNGRTPANAQEKRTLSVRSIYVTKPGAA